MRPKQLRAASWTVLALALSVECAAQTAPARKAAAGPGRGGSSVNPTGPSTYVLGPDDQISVHARNVQEITDRPVRIDSNGEIKLPMIGRMRAAGLTADQLEREMTKRLGVYLEEPEVVVTVTEFRSQPVSVIGEVGSPGIHQVQGHKTLIEVLSMAGGLRPDAGPHLKLTRRLDQGRIPLAGAKDDPAGGFSVAEVDVRALLESKNPEENVVIAPWDVISVPRAQIVYVIGDVGKAGPIVLNAGSSISVLAALSSSGGAQKTAKMSDAKILRPILGGPKRAELAIDLKKIMQGKANDLPLLAGDILYVPSSDSRKAGVRAAEAAIQAGTIALTYGVIR